MQEVKRKPVYSQAEFVADATVHVIGVIAAMLAVPVMITMAAFWHDGAVIAAVAIYGVSMLAMLATSAGYNFAAVRWPTGRGREILRRMDHGIIYVKIAGTYTPYLVFTGGALGLWMLVGVWAGAGLGLLGKLIAPHKWERGSIILYLALGWCLVFAAGPISDAISTATIVLIFVGGGLYTVGVVFHLWRSLPFQNAIWHIFVLLASFVFYAAIVVELALAA